MEDEPYDPPANERPDLRLCCCGCSEAEHDGAGRCRFCGSEDCGGFTYDEEATCIALALGEGFA